MRIKATLYIIFDMSLKRFFQSSVLTLALAIFLLAPSAQAQTATASLEEMLKTIQSLMTQIETLQKQLNTMRGEVKDIIRDGIAEGMSGDDITKLQELLASDPSIYPEGRVTGYFGPLTKEAIKRLQARHELSVTGEIDVDTKSLLEEYLKERFEETVPPGLLRAPGIAKKVEARIALGDCSKPGRALGPLCKKIKVTTVDGAIKVDQFEVEIEIEDGTTTVEFRYKGKIYETSVGSTNETDVLKAVADKLTVTTANLDAKLVAAIKKALVNALADTDNEAAEEAGDAIAKAKGAIEDAEEVIEDAEAGTAKDEATTLLAQAKTKLASAETALSDKDYDEAVVLANEAKKLADDAEDLVD